MDSFFGFKICASRNIWRLPSEDPKAAKRHRGESSFLSAKAKIEGRKKTETTGRETCLKGVMYIIP